MLAEYAITPDVFDQSSYATPGACDQHLRYLKDGLISRGLVRNLYNGEWFRSVWNHHDRWHKRGLELLRKLERQGRLCDSLASSANIPGTSVEWCQEALESHAASPLQGIISDQPTADLYKGEQLIAASTQLAEKTWWTEGNSVQLKRSKEDYLKALEATLKYSNSLMFIDPHLDPIRQDYQDFVELIKACGSRIPAPRIEIHRVCYSGSGPNRQIVSQVEWQRRFNSAIGKTVSELGLCVDVFLWDDFHDRYLISNLIGILMPNGFDTEANPSITRWARLDREHRDSVEKEFSQNNPWHVLRHAFKI